MIEKKMGYTYTPAYYSSLQDSISSICKSMLLPFSSNPRLTGAEHKLRKLQSDNLKWQQNSFHHILNLIGLRKEGIIPECELSAFRTHLLDSLIASKGPHAEPPSILRDKLLFLQELLYAKCISAQEYHASKRPLLQRLAVQGAELEASDVIVGQTNKDADDEEWSVIDLKDDHSLANNDDSKNKSRHGSSTVKHIKDAASLLGFGSFHKLGKHKSIFVELAANNNNHQFPVDNKNNDIDDNPFWNKCESKSILMPAADKLECPKGKRAAIRALFHADEKHSKSVKKQWKFDGFKRWNKTNVEDETTPLPLTDRASTEQGPYMQGPDTKQIKTKLLSRNSSSGFFIDKVVGNNIKKELSRIQTEMSTTNPNFCFSNDEMDAISTKLPVDKSDLKQFFPDSWCERYGDVVLDVVKKEFKDHVGEMESMRNASWERRCTSSKRWTTFEDDENCHPNLSPANQQTNSFF